MVVEEYLVQRTVPVVVIGAVYLSLSVLSEGSYVASEAGRLRKICTFDLC